MIPHLEYYKSIERDLINTGRYVEFSTDNYLTHSIEFARIIMASSSEIDNIFKLLCKAIDPNSNPQNILQYYPIITSKYPKFPTIEMEVPKYQLSFKPWNGWNDSASPEWWRGYNKIKHERELHFKRANLETSLNSVGGLFSLLLYLGVEKCGDYNNFQVDAFDAPMFLSPKNEPDDFMSHAGTFVSYSLPDFN